MNKTRSFELARQIAEEEKATYGISIVDGAYYIGTVEEIEKLPVVVKGNYSQ